MTLDGLIGHADPIVSETAELLKQFTEQLQNDEMTKDEFAELARNLLDMKRVDELTNDIERKVEIAKAFGMLWNIVTTFGSSLL